MKKSEYKEYPIIGTKYGKWTVISDTVKSGSTVHRGDSKSRTSYWLVKCECGLEKWTVANHLKTRASTCCKKCAHKTYYNELPMYYFKGLINRAKEIDVEFNLTKEYVWELFIKQNRKCKLSGLEIKFSETIHKKKEDFTASLDRIDSSKGYTVGNVQWIHKHINFMKYVFDQNYFIELCKLIVENCK